MRQRTSTGGVAASVVLSAGLITVCMVGPPGVAHVVAVATLSLAGLAGIVLAAVFSWQALLHWRFVRDLEKRSRAEEWAGFEVRVLPGFGTPFVAGFRPRIYCPAGVRDELSSVQIHAVLSHESWHRQKATPLRLLIVAALQRLIGWIPWVAAQLETATASFEVEADRFALERGAGRSTLASALVALAMMASRPGVAAFGAAADLRVRVLLGEAPDPRLDPTARAWMTAALITLGCFAFYLR